MWKWKSVIALAVVTIMAASAAGCSGENENSNGKEAVDANGVPVEPYEIQWFFDGSGQRKDTDLVEEEVNKYLKDKINATLQINCLDYGSYKNKLSTMMAGGEKFDISFASSSYYVGNVAKGSYLPLGELYDTYMPKTKEIVGEYALEAVSVNGEPYGIPANKDKAHHWGFIYRKDLADKYNIDMNAVKSFDDLFPILQIIKENEPNVIPLGMNNNQTPNMLIDFDKIDGVGAFYPDKEPGKVVNMYETPEYAEYIRKIREAYELGYIYKDAAVANFTQMQKEGKFFVYTIQTKPGKLEEMTVNQKYEYAIVDITEPIMMKSDVIGSVMTISRTSENPERVAQFMELFNTDRYLNNLIVFGLEGQHYNKISDTVIEPIADSGYGFAGLQWKFGNMFLNYLLPSEQPNKFELLQQYNDSAKKTETLGFSFDAEPVKIEMAACQNVIGEYATSLEMGSVDPDEVLPKFIQKLKQAGSDRIIAEQQAQYDKWKSGN